MMKIIYLITFLLIISSCATHKKSITGSVDEVINTQYCIEVLSNDGMIKVHSHKTGEFYIIRSEQFHLLINKERSE